MFIPHILSGDSISIYLESSDVYHCPNTHFLFNEIVQAVRSGNLKKVTILLKEQQYKGLKILEDKILFNGREINNFAVQTFFKLRAEGHDIEPMLRFLENSFKNKYPAIVEKLYDFLSSKGMPITQDGCFIAYKFCNRDFFDSHTGRTIQYIPGTRVEVEREDICDLSGEECSNKGLHVGNWEYSGMREGRENRRFLIVKVNPADVLSVPRGIDAKKIRVWAMDVLHEIGSVGEKLESTLVDKKGKELVGYKVGQWYSFEYRNGRGKIISCQGKVTNVGSMYMLIRDGYVVSRLKIANITKSRSL